MQAHYPLAFEREMGCTVDELRGWLPGAAGGRPIAWRTGGAEVALEGGRVTIEWRPLAPRRIAAITLPRASVRFSAHDVDIQAWQRFMRHFDLYTQRGGG